VIGSRSILFKSAKSTSEEIRRGRSGGGGGGGGGGRWHAQKNVNSNAAIHIVVLGVWETRTWSDLAMVPVKRERERRTEKDLHLNVRKIFFKKKIKSTNNNKRRKSYSTTRI
jgi:hypothetical protein